MASKWVPVRDAILDTLKIDKVTEEMKEDVTRWILSEILPAGKKAADEFCAQTKKQAANENGWCKVRDMIVLPFLIQGGVWLIERTLEKTVTNAVTPQA
jgi:hypothetical protein